MSKDKDETVVMTIRVPKDMRDELKEMSVRLGSTTSDLVRDSIKNILLQKHIEDQITSLEAGYPYKAVFEKRKEWINGFTKLLSVLNESVDINKEAHEKYKEFHDELATKFEMIFRKSKEDYANCNKMVDLYKDGKKTEEEVNNYIMQTIGLSLEEYIERMETERGLREVF